MTSTDDVSKVLAFCNQHVHQRGAQDRRDGHRRRSRDHRRELDRDRRQGHGPDRVDRRVRHAGHRAVRREAAGPRRPGCAPLGLTTGHSPQSKPIAMYGGLVATRSIGQFSTLYGGIEDMVMGLEAVLPSGEVVRIKDVPTARRRPRHPPRHHRQRGRALLHHRGHGEAVQPSTRSTTTTSAGDSTR